MVFGSPSSGKTTLAKYLKEKYEYNLVDYEKITAYLKEKLGSDDGPLEEVPIDAMIKYFAE